MGEKIQASQIFICIFALIISIPPQEQRDWQLITANKYFIIMIEIIKFVFNIVKKFYKFPSKSINFSSNQFSITNKMFLKKVLSLIPARVCTSNHLFFLDKLDDVYILGFVCARVLWVHIMVLCTHNSVLWVIKMEFDDVRIMMILSLKKL